MMTRKNVDSPQHLYIHVPFCQTICAYCDFCHVKYNAKSAKQWLDALKVELEKYPIQGPLKTIYIGGGTPSSLDYELLDQLLSLFDCYTDNCLEYTIEINPETLNLEKVKLMKKHGINRVSMGIQAYQPHLLELLNRKHTFHDVETSFALLKQEGITNIAVDIMYSLPTQTMDAIKETLNHVLLLKPAHISIYSLTIEEGTLFAKKGYQPLDEDLEADMYEYLCLELKKHGFEQYEISNFCFNHQVSQHNLAYWQYHDFYGYGAGASGKENHMRYDHTKNLTQYMNDPTKREIIPLTKEDEMFEMLMMSLRLVEGISKEDFYHRFQVTLDDVYGPINQKMKTMGYLEETSTHIRCTEKGLEILNSVLENYL